MDTLVHADIFFIVTTAFVGIISIGAAIATYFIIGILRDLKHLTGVLKEESERINGDLARLHATVREEGNKFKAIFDFLIAFGQQRRDRKSSRTKE